MVPRILLTLFMLIYITCRLIRHFKDDLKRLDLNVLSKDNAKFDSFQNALDSRMKEMTALGIGTNEI